MLRDHLLGEPTIVTGTSPKKSKRKKQEGEEEEMTIESPKKQKIEQEGIDKKNGETVEIKAIQEETKVPKEEAKQEVINQSIEQAEIKTIKRHDPHVDGIPLSHNETPNITKVKEENI